MKKAELFSKIESIFSDYLEIRERSNGWFDVYCGACVFPDEIDKLCDLCFVSNISIDPIELNISISCNIKKI